MHERFVNNVVDFVINPAEIKNGRNGVIAQTILARIKRTERIFSFSNKSQRDIVYEFVVCPEHARSALNRAQWSYVWGPPGGGWGGGGPHSIGPGGLFWTRRRADVGFLWVVQADTHAYFLPRPKADRLLSKSGPDMIISCGDLRLVGSTRHRKVSHNPGLGPAARWGGVPKVAPEPSPYMVLRAVWLVALVFQKIAPELLPCPVGVLVVAPMGWCSKS